MSDNLERKPTLCIDPADAVIVHRDSFDEAICTLQDVEQRAKRLGDRFLQVIRDLEIVHSLLEKGEKDAAQSELYRILYEPADDAGDHYHV